MLPRGAPRLLLLLLVAAAASLLFAVPAHAQEEGETAPCTITAPNGDFYDLSPLTRTKGDDWVAKDGREENQYLYRLNVCAPILFRGTEKNPIPANVAAHQQNATNEDRHYDLGLVSTTLVYADGVVSLTYPNGDMCKRSQTPRTAIISFTCNPSAGDGQPVFLLEDSDCNYIFEWDTAIACPNRGTSLSAGAIFGIVLLILFVVYFLGIFFYRSFILGKKGRDQIPHYTFCASVCGALMCWSKKGVQYRSMGSSRTQDGGVSLMDDDDLFDDDFDDDAVEKI